jgi:hypothetical protein
VLKILNRNKENKMTPYFYKILHKNTGKIYVGSQYGKNSDPKNLWKSYFSSSVYVKKLIEQYGTESFEILMIKERPDAREYEQRYLLRMYYALGRDKFCDIFINKNLSPGILLTEEMIEKANIKRRISMPIASKKLLEEGRHNFQLFPNAGEYEHVRKLRSERMMGNTYSLGKMVTNETRNKIAEGVKGNTNVRNTKWWNNGKQRKRSKVCPGEGWKEGFQIN